jgi:hypothetical protein
MSASNWSGTITAGFLQSASRGGLACRAASPGTR